MLRTYGYKPAIHDLVENARKLFVSTYGYTPSLPVISVAPGRANLIGEHTDYNEGYVMPVAISRYTVIYGEYSDEPYLEVCSSEFPEQAKISLESPEIKDEWWKYIAADILALRKRNYKIHGGRAVIFSNLPVGAGLSSSASIEIATVGFLTSGEIDRKEAALVGYDAEHNILGINCGIMDQYIIALGQEGSALFIDTRGPKHEYVRFKDENISVLLLDTRVQHEAKEVLNTRANECREAIKIISQKYPSVHALRDVTPEMLDAVLPLLPPVLQKRVKHVVLENKRVHEMKEALTKGEWNDVRRIMKEGHESCRDLYEVSCPELDLLVNIVENIDGVIGTRMTGAGLGGNTITLVWKEEAEKVANIAGNLYREKTGIIPGVIISKPTDGAEVIC